MAETILSEMGTIMVMTCTPLAVGSNLHTNVYRYREAAVAGSFNTESQHASSSDHPYRFF